MTKKTENIDTFPDEQIEAVKKEVEAGMHDVCNHYEFESDAARLILQARAERDTMAKRLDEAHTGLRHFVNVVAPRLIAECDAALARVRELEACRETHGPSEATTRIDAERSPEDMLYVLTLVRTALGQYMADCGRHIARIAALEAENASKARANQQLVSEVERLMTENAELRDKMTKIQAIENHFHRSTLRDAENERLRRLVENTPHGPWPCSSCGGAEDLLRAALKGEDK